MDQILWVEKILFSKMPVTETIQQAMQKSRWQRLRAGLLSRSAVRFYWCVNVLMLLVILVWILRDGKFSEAVVAFHRHVAALGNEQSALTVVPPLLWPRVDALWFVLVAGLLSTMGIFAGLVAGAGVHRGVRAWLAVTLVLAGWMTLFKTWQEITWWGQAWRLRGSITEFDKLAQKLLADWPANDGEIIGLGPFMAYPIGKPRTLMFMATPQVPGTALAVSTIERSEADDLHFKLAGNEEGVWIVRHSGVDEPHSFFSGLEGQYIPVKFRRLKPGWFLVRYIYVPIVSSESR